MTRFYKVEDTRVQEFYQLPKDLILNPKYDKLSANAKIVYTILKDRHSVSLKNNWHDDTGVYFLFSDNELAEVLKMSVRSASRHKNDLKKYGLIHMARQGRNMRNKIYLLKPEFNAVEMDTPILSSPDTPILSSPDTPILSTYSNNNLSNNNLSNKEEEEEDPNLQNLISFCEKNICKVNDVIKNELAEWLKIRDYEFIIYEMTECAKLGAKTFKYVSTAFNDSINQNLVSIGDLNKKYEPKPKKQTKAPRNGFKQQTRTEKLPDWYENRNNDKKQVGNNSNSDELEARRKKLLDIQAKYQKEKDVK